MEGAAQARARIFGSNAAVEAGSRGREKRPSPREGRSNAVCQVIGLSGWSLQKPTRRDRRLALAIRFCRR